MTMSITTLTEVATGARAPLGPRRLSDALSSLWSRLFRSAEMDREASTFQQFSELVLSQAVGAVTVSPSIRASHEGSDAEPTEVRIYEIHFSAVGRSGCTLRYVDELTRAPLPLLIGRGSGQGRARAALDGLANAIYAARVLRRMLPWAAVTVGALSPEEEDAVLEAAGALHIAPRERYAETISGRSLLSA